MFNLGREHKKARDVPVFPHLKENNVRKGYLEDGQYRKLVEYCPDLWFRSLVDWAEPMGGVSELLNMRVSQINLFSA